MEIDKRRRQRYFTIGNLAIFLAGAVLVALGGFSPVPPQVANVLLNIGCDIIVIGIVFFFGKFLLIDPQRDEQEQLDRIELLLESKSSFFLTREQRNARHPFDEFIGRANDLFLGGVALRATGRGFRSVFEERLREGAHLRFAILDPESPEVDAIAQEHDVTREYVSSDIRNTLSELGKLQYFAATNKCGSVEIRLLRRELVFSFALRDPYRADGVLLADLRVYGLDTGFRPCWQLTPADKPWYERFIKMCESLWADSLPVQQ